MRTQLGLAGALWLSSTTALAGEHPAMPDAPRVGVGMSVDLGDEHAPVRLVWHERTQDEPASSPQGSGACSRPDGRFDDGISESVTE